MYMYMFMDMFAHVYMLACVRDSATGSPFQYELDP